MRMVWLLSVVLLTACEEEQLAPPPPAAMSDEAIGHFCLMNVAEHPGPKGQAHIAGRTEPVWFPTVRDLLTFRVLPGETQEVTALYVSDTGAAPSYGEIDPEQWIAVDEALFVIGSSIEGGMGQSEAVPFADRVAAEAFAAQYGGHIVAHDAIGNDWIFGESG